MFRKILVVVDDRPVTQVAIAQAIEMAQVHRADIFLLGVVPNRYDYLAVDMHPVADALGESLQVKAAEEVSRLLAEASAWAERLGVHNYRAISTEPDVAQAVADTAAIRHCDLIVVGTEEQNAVVRLLSGSIIPGLISRATVPVLVCRESCLRRTWPKKGSTEAP
jgi:nucleotide-binding universal stress UspA family protein